MNYIRNVTGIRKVGHSGTLDPLASGLLIILVGRNYTKLQDVFLKKKKTYVCTAQLGIETDTYDSTGTIINKADWEKLKNITSSIVELALKSYRGDFFQTVPAFSAIKMNGQKLYRKALKKTLDLDSLPQKKVTVESLILTKLQKHLKNKVIYITIEATVGSGTYIRSLIHDLGKQLGVGAVITELRRTKIADFSVENAHKITGVKTLSYARKIL